MSDDRRKANRQDMHWESMAIDLEGSPICPCMMVNVSATGAKLVLPTAQDVPDRFVLVLSQKGEVKRHCTVTWRAEDSVGVRFLTPAHSPDNTSYISDALARMTSKAQ